MSLKFRLPSPDQQVVLEQVQPRLLAPSELPRCHRLLDKHHYLKSLKPVGERLSYVATDAAGQWLALLVFSAAAKHLKVREQWIGWTERQRQGRLALVVNLSRFCLLPGKTFPNLGSKVLRLTLDRLSADWQAQYAHPVLIAETFVDPAHFCGTVFSANGWVERGKTDGWGRYQRDYYVKHDKPKRLFVRELCRNARRRLQAEHLQAALAAVEAQVTPRPGQSATEIGSLAQRFHAVPDFRQRVESYPLRSLLTVVLLAVLCEAPRGSKDLAKFARGFSQGQRRALGIRRHPQGHYPAPSQSTFCRLLQKVDGRKLEKIILEIQEQVRGQAPKDDLIVLDGKEPNHGGGQGVLTAVASPSQFYLGSEIVEEKTNEIPVAPQLLARLDLRGRMVSLDALNTQHQTARAIVLEGGGDYLLTVKGNQPTVRENIKKFVPAPAADFPPEAPTPTQCRTVEKNKERACESRSITTCALSAEQAAFPWVAQGARLLRQTTGRKDEEVGLLTSAEPAKLPALAWLQLNRLHWDVESGLHQRLDVSHNDDRCRIRLSPGLWVMGMFRRLSNSLFMEWRGAQKHPEHKTTTDFQAAMGEEQRRPALLLIDSKHPRFKGG